MARVLPIRMLIVEDAEAEARALAEELGRRNVVLEWRRVDNAAELADALSYHAWDLIVCDHNLPALDTGEALDLVRQSGLDVPFIVYSGQASDHQIASTMRNGAHDFVEKGNYVRLLPVIERELRHAATRRAMRQADRRIRELAYYDALSSLPNHTLFCSRITEWLLGVERRGTAARAAIFFVDVDRFMRINGSFGYETGNDILRQMAQRLSEAAQAKALIARLAGDAFGIFLPWGADDAALAATAEALRRCFEAPFRKGALDLFLTASVGVARYPDDGSEVYELMMNAETAMAQVKRQGGNAVQFYRREMTLQSAARMALESDLRHAVGRGELLLHYQPLVDAGDDGIVGAEALLRWRHPQRGLVSPGQFIGVADESGLILDIGAWVLREACLQTRRWHDLGRTLYVSVNVSAVQFAQPSLIEAVSRILAETGLPPDCLHLEITETALMSDAESAAAMLRGLKNMGVCISVDDFGTGYSSLSYLRRFPIDTLKIDRSFVLDVAADADAAAIVRAVIALGRALRLTVVAEGVENEDQASFLRSEGCDRLQGFRVARPLDADGLTALLFPAGPGMAG